eukprot:12399763-Karenia_brevis.AAC.3
MADWILGGQQVDLGNCAHCIRLMRPRATQRERSSNEDIIDISWVPPLQRGPFLVKPQLCDADDCGYYLPGNDPYGCLVHVFLCSDSHVKPAKHSVFLCVFRRRRLLEGVAIKLEQTFGWNEKARVCWRTRPERAQILHDHAQPYTPKLKVKSL